MKYDNGINIQHLKSCKIFTGNVFLGTGRFYSLFEIELQDMKKKYHIAVILSGKGNFYISFTPKYKK